MGSHKGHQASTMSIDIRQVQSRKDLKKFIFLPEKLHKDHKNWLPPIYIDEWKYFNPKKNREFIFCETILYLAYKNGRPAGRIMGIINNKYNKYRGIRQARFGYFECINDPELAGRLLQSIETWGREQGMEHIIGPYGFSDKDPQGFLVEGYEHIPIPVSACNFPYMNKLVEAAGYKKEIDCLVYKYDLSNDLPEIYGRVFNRVKQSGNFQFHEFTTKKEMNPFVMPVLSLMNDAYGDIYGFAPLDEKEMKDLASRYMPILNPHFVKAISHKEELVGFLVGLPNLSKGIQRSRGRLFPFGLVKIIIDSKKTSQVDLMLVGIKEAFRGRGLDVILAMKLVESARKLGYKNIEVHLMLETNKRVLGEMNKAGAKPHKRFRVYRKGLRP